MEKELEKAEKENEAHQKEVTFFEMSLLQWSFDFFVTCGKFLILLSSFQFACFMVSFKLAKAHCELNKRIFEHDKCMAEGMTDIKKEVTLQVCLSLK